MADKPISASWTWAILLVAGAAGVLLRWAYVEGTPPALRAHDFQGHLDYLSFVLEYGRMPSHSQGFQGYQPPLYYFIAAPLGPGPEPGGPLDVLALQRLSLWISVATLGVGLWVGRMLFAQSPMRLALFCMAIASFPGLVYGASRVSNDGLVQLLLFLGLGLLIHWWQTGQSRWWMLAAGVAGLGILTKANGLMLLPIAGAMLWQRAGTGRRRLLAWGAGIVTAISGWLVGVRLWIDQTPSVVPNTSYLPPELHLDTSVMDLIWFNPVRVLQYPFGNRLEWLQQEQGLWEYYFRSAFFGEFPISPALRNEGWLILLLAMVLLPVLGLGLWRALRAAPGAHAHLWAPLIVLLNIHGIYRVVAPFTPSQDFRYTSLVLLPAVALALHGADGLPRLLRWAVWAVMGVLIGACAHFLIVLVSAAG